MDGGSRNPSGFCQRRSCALARKAIVPPSSDFSLPRPDRSRDNPEKAGCPRFAPYVDVTISPSGDSYIEGDETVIFTITSSETYTINGDATTASVMILDDELSTITLTVSETELDELETSTSSLVLTRTGEATGTLTVTYSLSGTALEDEDYELTGTAFFPAGEDEIEIIVTPLEERRAEEGEEIVFTIETSARYDIASGSEDATLTILNDDYGPTTTGIDDVEAVEEDAPFVIDLWAAFADADDADEDLFFDVGAGSDGVIANVDQETGELSLTFVSDYQGDTLVLVECVDTDGNLLSAYFRVEVANVNDAPSGVEYTVGIIENGPDQSIPLDQLFADIDDLFDAMSFEVVDNSNPALVSWDINEGSGELDIFLLEDESGTAILDLLVTDEGEFTGHTTITVLVLPSTSALGAVTFSALANNLAITGSTGSDSIAIDVGDGEVTLNGEATGLDPADFRYIDIATGAGADTIDLSGMEATDFTGLWKTTIRSEDGNDLIVGSFGSDDIFAGAGDDSANGGAGFDWLYGGAGSDTLGGGPGDDRLQANDGEADGSADSLDGGAGNDTLIVAESSDSWSDSSALNTIQNGASFPPESIYPVAGTGSGFGAGFEAGSYSGSPPTIEIETEETEVDEDSEVELTISRSGSTASSLAVQLYFAGTATLQNSSSYAAGDYKLIDGEMGISTTVTFSSGIDSITLSLHALPDSSMDPDEHAVIGIAPSPVGAYLVGVDSSCSVTIKNESAWMTAEYYASHYMGTIQHEFNVNVASETPTNGWASEVPGKPYLVGRRYRYLYSGTAIIDKDSSPPDKADAEFRNLDGPGAPTSLIGTTNVGLRAVPDNGSFATYADDNLYRYDTNLFTAWPQFKYVDIAGDYGNNQGSLNVRIGLFAEFGPELPTVSANPDPLTASQAIVVVIMGDFGERQKWGLEAKAKWPGAYVYTDFVYPGQIFDMLDSFPDGSISRIILTGHGTTPDHVGVQVANNGTDDPRGATHSIDTSTIGLDIRHRIRDKLDAAGMFDIQSCAGITRERIAAAQQLADDIGHTVRYSVGVMNKLDVTPTEDDKLPLPEGVEAGWRTAEPH